MSTHSGAPVGLVSVVNRPGVKYIARDLLALGLLDVLKQFRGARGTVCTFPKFASLSPY
jgi:hypothetical protein